MAINLGLYDVFANIVPGIVYLTIVYQIGKLLGLNTSLITNLPDISLILIGLIFALILGQLLNHLSYAAWYRFFDTYRKSRQVVLKQISENQPKLRFKFDPDDADVLLAIIHHNDFQVGQKIETMRANGILMRNLSFGFFLHFLIGIAQIILAGAALVNIAYPVCAIFFSAFALRRGKDFLRWFYRDIFLEAINYGDDVNSVLKESRRRTKVAVKR